MSDDKKIFTREFVRHIVTIHENMAYDPFEDIAGLEAMLKNMPPSADKRLDELRRQDIEAEIAARRSRSQLLTYCQRQVAEMNQSKADMN